MTSDKKNIFILAGLLHKKGITHVVTSPGSRNAPAIIIFNRTGWFNMYSIVDERAAGFFALGMAQALNKPIALLCTSGTATLNYYPALAEAFYQQIPLIFITADRPAEWIDQADGQTIRQVGLFTPHSRHSINLSENSSPTRYISRLINSAIDRATYPVQGPVHINLPLREPLYDLDFKYIEKIDYSVMQVVPPQHQLPETMVLLWKNFKKKMILVGQLPPNPHLKHLWERLINDPTVIVFSEATSNTFHPHSISCIDRTIETLTAEEIQELKPDLLVSLGKAVVSKKIKALLRNWKPAQHWHISSDVETLYIDTYLNLTHTLPVSIEIFLASLPKSSNPSSDYRDRWLNIKKRVDRKHEEFIKKPWFTDFFVFKEIFENLPPDEVIHLGNSTPIRYAQLFEHQADRKFFGNRGTSGIDGCISTAAGYAAASGEPVSIITGDIGFFYESNALWNKHIPPTFTILLINNGGGNIFRIIDGPSQYEELETFIETSHQTRAQGIAESFGAKYFRADDFASLKAALSGRYSAPREKPAVIEIITKANDNSLILKQYFTHLK